ncbi:hypothetical protein AAG570_000563 [Ranatra chinensis]|uniref:Mpv17-like protein n=1 Tax=Ranatra chinensis TaxID=642074 RepID=A0ABD0ZIL0_9HEMI
MAARKKLTDLLGKVVEFTHRYPVTRGMASYAVIWPLGSLIQQTVEGREKYDLWRTARFSFYGSCYVAPTLNMWMHVAKHMWPQNTIGAAVAKAAVEQISYTPFAMVSFYFGMSLLEGKTVREAGSEVGEKFIPTYKVGICVWPVLQTINYMLVPEKNRVVFVSICSLMWTSFLAYMKFLQGTHFHESYAIPLAHERKR